MQSPLTRRRRPAQSIEVPDTDAIDVHIPFGGYGGPSGKALQRSASGHNSEGGERHHVRFALDPGFLKAALRGLRPARSAPHSHLTPHGRWRHRQRPACPDRPPFLHQPGTVQSPPGSSPRHVARSLALLSLYLDVVCVPFLRNLLALRVRPPSPQENVISSFPFRDSLSA